MRDGCSLIEDQEQIGACTAHAGVGLIEYFQRRAFERHVDASRLFLYKVTRNLLHWTGDTGAYLRTTMKAMVAFGVPPEEYWEYDTSRYDEEPGAFLYSFAREYQSIQYARLDPRGTGGEETLRTVKSYLAAGFPSMFGFPVYSSLSDDPDIPFPSEGDRLRGGHAVMAVGYDDDHRIGADKGALLIRNSWGTDWGDEGYGWLPHAYVTEQLAVDFWTVLRQDWLDTGQFDRPR
ncbi:MAG: hypothetical protein JXB62_03985 [Pirellulales bacterium]|nr:hypothetical protein [Pirellulales bacterium]